MTAHSLGSVFLVALALHACASAPTSDAVADPVGCWYFERNDAAVALQLPWGVRMAADSLTGWRAIDARGGARVAATLNADGVADHPFGYWMTLPGDSVEIGYPAGGGIVLRLAAGETTMRGTTREVGDALVPGAEPRRPHDVRLDRARCPAY